jgi:hypothetical protein
MELEALARSFNGLFFVLKEEIESEGAKWI